MVGSSVIGWLDSVSWEHRLWMLNRWYHSHRWRWCVQLWTHCCTCKASPYQCLYSADCNSRNWSNWRTSDSITWAESLWWIKQRSWNCHCYANNDYLSVNTTQWCTRLTSRYSTSWICLEAATRTSSTGLLPQGVSATSHNISWAALRSNRWLTRHWYSFAEEFR